MLVSYSCIRTACSLLGLWFLFVCSASAFEGGPIGWEKAGQGAIEDARKLGLQGDIEGLEFLFFERGAEPPVKILGPNLGIQLKEHRYWFVRLRFASKEQTISIVDAHTGTGLIPVIRGRQSRDR